jgi:hypothetical protein
MRTFLAGPASCHDETHIGMSGLRGADKFVDIDWDARVLYAVSGCSLV